MIKTTKKQQFQSNLYNDILQFFILVGIWDGTSLEHLMIFMGTSWDIGFNQPASWILGEASRMMMNYEGWSLRFTTSIYGLGGRWMIYGWFNWSLWYFYHGEMIFDLPKLSKLGLSEHGEFGIPIRENWRATTRFGVAYFRQIGQLLYDMYMMLHSHQQHFSLALKQSHASVKRWFNGSIATCLERVSLALPAARLKIWVEW